MLFDEDGCTGHVQYMLRSYEADDNDMKTNRGVGKQDDRLIH